MAFAPIFGALSLGTQAAGLGMSLFANKQQQRASQQQGEAQARAAEAEAKRKQAETAENQRRMAENQGNTRSTQLARSSSSGFSGASPLAIMAESLSLQQRELSDSQYGSDMTTRGLLNEAVNSRYGAATEVSRLKSQRTSMLIEGIGGLASSGYQVARNYPRKVGQL